MKKAIMLIAVIIVGTLLYVNFITAIYARRQAKSICKWINERKGDKPSIGPQASEHLVWLQEESNGAYECEVVKPPRDFLGYKETSILISEKGAKKMYLIYELSCGGRSFMQPIYFQHQTDFDHTHNN